VVGSGVLLADMEAAELGLEAVASALAAGEAGGEDHAVVGQGGCGDAEAVDGLPEGGDDTGPGDAGVGSDAEGVAGAVVEPAEDLDVRAGAPVVGSQAVVGEVGLPAFVGEVCLEAGVGGAGSFGGAGHDEASAAQVAADRGGRDRDAVVVGQVPGDGVGPGIEALAGEVSTELADQLHGGLGDGSGRALGASRARLEGGLAFAPEACDQAADPALGEAVGAGDLVLRAAFDDDGGDDKTGL